MWGAPRDDLHDSSQVSSSGKIVEEQKDFKSHNPSYESVSQKWLHKQVQNKGTINRHVNVDVVNCFPGSQAYTKNYRQTMTAERRISLSQG